MQILLRVLPKPGNFVHSDARGEAAKTWLGPASRWQGRI